MSSSALRIGFIGAGFVANFHRLALQSVRGVELSGVFALKGAEELAAASRADGMGDTKVYSSIAKLCKEVDMVAILNPNFARVETIRQIAKAAGQSKLLGVVCEKPLGRTVGEALEIVAQASGAGLRTAYFENQIHMQCVTGCRKQLAKVAAKMGPVHLTRSAEEHGGPHQPWFWDPTQQGGGVWSDMGCHSAAVGMFMLTPDGEPLDFLKPTEVNATMALLKWGREPWISQLKARGVDYKKTPAEDYATVTIKFKNPKTGQIVIAQATDSWMYDAPGLRLLMEAMGPGYSYGVNSLTSPAGLFISDAAAEAIGDAEVALEKSQAQRGSLIVQPDEPRLYGYVDEWIDAANAFRNNRDACLNFAYGARVTRLIAAGYLSSETKKTVSFDDVADDYIPKIHRGQGASVLK